MPIDVNSTASLLGAFGVVDRPVTVMLDMFFPYEQRFETEEIYFDKVQRARRLAPFVVPTIQGKPEPTRAYKTIGFKPPYVKPKHVLEPFRALKRLAGETLLGGNLSPQERFERSIMDNMTLEQEEITRREEWMATQLLLTGTVTCASDDHPPVILNMQRNSGHTIALTGGAAWGQTGVDPLANIRSWGGLVQQNSGYNPNVVIMDPLAGAKFTSAPGVLQVMNSFRQQSGEVNLAGVVTGGGLGDEIQFLGAISGYTIFQYQQLYADPDGTVKKFMPDNTVLMANKAGVQGTRCYGAIYDPKAGMMPLSRFPKAWIEEDPPRWMIMTQSAPLPVLGWIDASFCATVA